MVAGLHIVRKLRKGRPAIFYVYAWRGGPLIHRAEGVRPKITAELSDRAAEERKQRRAAPAMMFARIIEDYRASPDFTGLAASTKKDVRQWMDRIMAEFGDAPIAVFEDRKMRGAIIDWSDQWAHQPRTADKATGFMAQLLNWAVERGRLSINVAAGIRRRYQSDRAEIVWTESDIALIRQHASAEVMAAIELASLTGLRRSDLIAVPWEAVGDTAIVWLTSKSRRRVRATIPLLPESRALLDRLRPTDPQGPILRNSRGQPWTADGLSTSFGKAARAAGIDKRLHDLRGTFATRLILAGATDDEAARVMGWQSKDISQIRARYVDEMRVVTSIAARLTVNRV